MVGAVEDGGLIEFFGNAAASLSSVTSSPPPPSGGYLFLMAIEDDTPSSAGSLETAASRSRRPLAIVARIELRYSYEELAVALGKPSPDAARMAVTRAVYRLAHEINEINDVR